MGAAIEEIAKLLGNFGRYQAFLYALVFLPGFMAGLLSLTFSWTGYTPNVRCVLPGETTSNANYSAIDDTHLRDRWYPPSADQNEERALCTYCPNSTLCKKENAIKCDRGIVYDTSIFKTSLIIEYEMVCEDSYKKEVTRVCYMLGVFMGALICGTLSDRYGRRRSFLFFGLTSIIFLNVEFLLLGLGYIPMLITYFIAGAMGDGAYLTSYVLFMESVGGFPKTLLGVWFQATYTIGMFYAALIAYYQREWKMIQIFYGIPPLFYLLYFWLFPESYRWALTNHKPELSKKLIARASKWNNVVVPEKLILEASAETKTEFEGANILNMFRNGSHLAKQTLIIGVTWLATSMSYYGLTFNTQDLPGDVFLSYCLSAASELPGFLLCVPIMEKLGRRTALVIFLGTGGVSCIGAGLIKEKTAVLILAMIGKMCAAAAYAIIYNYTVEVFPTVLRSSGTSFGSMSGRIGSISAPLLHNLATYVLDWLPIVIYGTMAVFASVLDLFLPETKGREYPETIEDAIHYNDKEYWEIKQRNKQAENNLTTKL
uniref:Major facilitator superfamily (MFS) profile domain-containing protein n=1 Tax=Plectus sambesii TaxID=2011161 RepID=A0A914XA04_9BILA